MPLGAPIANGQTRTTQNTTHTVAINPGAVGTSGLLVVRLRMVDGTTTSTQQFGGSGLTSAGSAVGASTFWYFKAPTASTSQNLTFSSTAFESCDVSWASWADVDQTTPTGTLVGQSLSTAVQRSTGSITCPTDGVVWGAFWDSYSDVGATAAAGTLIQTEGGTSNVCRGHAYRTTTGALAIDDSNYAFAWEFGGFPINAAAGATAELEQEGFRWGNDDGSESAHTWAAAQDANITAPAGQTRLLNMLVNVTGDPGAKTFKLQFRKVGDPGWTDVPIQ